MHVLRRWSSNSSNFCPAPSLQHVQLPIRVVYNWKMPRCVSAGSKQVLQSPVAQPLRPGEGITKCPAVIMSPVLGFAYSEAQCQAACAHLYVLMIRSAKCCSCAPGCGSHHGHCSPDQAQQH
jgi:hypothetical protein